MANIYWNNNNFIYFFSICSCFFPHQELKYNLILSCHLLLTQFLHPTRSNLPIKASIMLLCLFVQKTKTTYKETFRRFFNHPTKRWGKLEAIKSMNDDFTHETRVKFEENVWKTKQCGFKISKCFSFVSDWHHFVNKTINMSSYLNWKHALHFFNDLF